MNFSDETLMAYADGELDPAQRHSIEKAMRDDPRVAAAVERHRALRARVAGAYACVLDEPVPQRLQPRAAPRLVSLDAAREARRQAAVAAAARAPAAPCSTRASARPRRCIRATASASAPSNTWSASTAASASRPSRNPMTKTASCTSTCCAEPPARLRVAPRPQQSHGGGSSRTYWQSSRRQARARIWRASLMSVASTSVQPAGIALSAFRSRIAPRS